MFSMHRRPRRLFRELFSPPVALVISIALAGIVFGALMFFRVPFDRTIGIAGVLLGLVTFAAAQIQQTRPANRDIVFLARSRNQFAYSVLRGLKDQLGDRQELKIIQKLPEVDIQDPLGWQLKMLSRRDVAGSAALVIIPAANDATLWSELALLSRSGIFIVTVDEKPPKRSFANSGTLRPFFVGSDFGAGGKLLADYLIPLLNEHLDDKVVIALGPVSSWPGMERSAKLLFHLCAAGFTSRTTCLEISSFTDNVEGPKILAALKETYSRCSGSVHVFCANDKILKWIQKRLDTETALELSRICLIGYDGSTDDRDEYMIAEARCAKATIDALPFEQGRNCGIVLLNEYDGALNLNSLNMLIKPNLREF